MSNHRVDFPSFRSNPLRCECGEVARLGLGYEVLSDAEVDKYGQPVWICDACGGYAACRPSSIIPRSVPAKAPTRDARALAWNARQAAIARLRRRGRGLHAARRISNKVMRKALNRPKAIVADLTLEEALLAARVLEAIEPESVAA